MKKRLYLLSESFPEYAVVYRQNKKEKITYENFEEFKHDIPQLLELCKENNVFLLLDPLKCKNLDFKTVFGFFKQIGLNRLNDYGDIGFYTLDGDNPIFTDLLEEYINSHTLNNDDYTFESEKLLNKIKNELLGIDYNEKVVNKVSKYFLTDEKLKVIANKKYNCKCNLKSIIYKIYLETKNENDIKQIVRELLLEDEIFSRLNIIDKNYELIGKYLSENYTNCLSFKEIEKIINDDFNYQMILYYNYLENYGFYVKYFDFVNDKVVFGIVY